MPPIYKYTGDQTKVYSQLKNRNGTTVKAEPGKLFDFQNAPMSNDANGIPVEIPEFVQLSAEDVERERAGEDTTTTNGYVAPSGDGGTLTNPATPANADIPAGTTPESLIAEAEAKVKELIAAAEAEAKELAEVDVEPHLEAAKAEAEKIIEAAKAKIEELFGHTPPSS